MSKVGRVLLGLLAVLVLLAAAVFALNRRDEAPIDERAPPLVATQAQIQRGAYLARVGNCAACHTARGGQPFAGGLGIPTPFGTVYASNITPDAATGIGRWSAAHFWRAMHNGRARDGRLLYPAFPYPNFTQVTRQDSDALYAYLRSLAPVSQPNRPHALRFPANMPGALAIWRALFFTPGVHRDEPSREASWNRGAYLVRGLGHCNACHASRNALGATRTESLELSGGLIPMQNWYAPSLASAEEAGVADWERADVVALLKTGVSARSAVMGPMAEVVYRSTQYLDEADLAAMATYLQSLPQAPVQRVRPLVRLDATTRERGAKLYETHCAQCHGKHGEGVAHAYPPLAGSRAVTMDNPANLVRAVLAGGFAPSTAGNPRPYGMPPFGQTLSESEIATLLTYIRASWGNQAQPVSALQVMRYR
jgi:mono/diheme cytochrome c family protein